MYKTKIINIFFKILYVAVFTFVFSSMIICIILARSIQITDSYEEIFYEEIDPELQISFQDHNQRLAKNENENENENEILFVNENGSL